MKKQILFGICICMLLFGLAQAADNSGRNSHFWLTIKPLAGNDTEVWSDMVLANGYRRVDLYSPDLACTRVNQGSNTIYTVIWTGNSFLGDDGVDILRFDLVVDFDKKTFAMKDVTIGGAELSANGLELHDFDSHFKDGNLQLNFIIRNPSLLVEDPDHVYGDLPNGHTYGPIPYKPTTQAKLDQAFPKFSWDRLQRTMLIRHSRAGYTDRQIERMAKSYPVIVLEKANGGFTGSKPKDHAWGGPAAVALVGGGNSDFENGKFKKSAPPAQLYDLEADVNQTTNLYNQYPEVVQELKALLKTYKPIASNTPKIKGQKKIQK